MTSLISKRLRAPLDVQFDITRACQLNCSYCCAAPLDGVHVPTEKALEVITELADEGVIALLLLGGEPTLHPDFLKILSFAASKIPLLSFGTNGIRFAKGKFASEVKFAAPNVLATISLDALDLSINDEQRGSGNQALRAIEACIAADLSLSISCVLTEHNIDIAHKMIDRYFPDIRKFSFFPKVPRSNAERFLDYGSFTDKLVDFVAKMQLLTIQEPLLKIQLPFRASDRRPGFEIGPKGACCCQDTKSYITTDLNVYPCYYSLSAKNHFGNLHEQRFADLWNGQLAEQTRKRGSAACLCGMSFFEDNVPTRFADNKVIYISGLCGGGPPNS